MATSPKMEALPEPGDIISLDPNAIRLGERLRPIDDAWATAIGQSMAREGQIHPVDVRWNALADAWELAGAGGHRVTGARLANLPIDAKVVMFGDDIARRREAAENLFRRSNDPIERAEAIAELVRLHRERMGVEQVQHREQSLPKRLKAETSEACDTMSHVYGWASEVADELGFSKRTIQRDLFLYRGLRASLIERLREVRHPILKNASQLRTLARLDGAEQSTVVDRLLGGARSVGDALANNSTAGRIAPSAEDKRLSAFLGAFGRMGLAEKKGALVQLAGMLPAGFELKEVR